MIPRQPSGTLLSKSDPVGAAGKGAPVNVSTSTSSPARSLALFKAGAWLSGNTRARRRISQAIGLAGHRELRTGPRRQLLGASRQRISSHDRFTIESLKIHGLTRIGIVDDSRMRADRTLCLTYPQPVGRCRMSIVPFSSSIKASFINDGSAEQYVRTGGSGPAVLLLHGFGDTGDMWQPLAEVLVGDHRVIVPDLRGMGLSTHLEGGYEKTSQARDLASILDRLGVDQVMLVTHDIGNMVGYAFAAQLPQRVTKWIAMDAPLPGLGTWEKQLLNPLVWHFNFRGPDVERLVAGRE